jgi:FkbM family methyltransferase
MNNYQHGEFLDIFEQHNHPHTYSVTCVEPMPKNLKVLQSKINEYRRVQAVVCPVAISDVTETKTFFEGNADKLFTCDKSWLQENPKYFKNPIEVKIDCLTMVDLAKKYNIDINEPFDFIKIDTEGHDLNVIKSLLSANIKTFAVMFEIRSNLSDIIAAVDLLTEHGFNELYVFGRKGIHTLYIGEYKGGEQLHELRQKRRLDAVNVIAFHNQGFVRN